jgi:hypothetical protein
VKLVNRPVAEWSDWIDAHGTSVLIPIAVPSSLRMEVLAAALDFETRWASISVTLEHRPPGAVAASQTVELDAAHHSATWTLPLDGVRGDVSATLTYRSRHGEAVVRRLDHIVEDQVIVTDPFDSSRVSVVVIPAGTGWNDVALAMVDLRYVDGAHVVDETVELRKLDDLVAWQAPARPDGPKQVQWRAHVSFADGKFESRAWQSTDTGIVVVSIDTVPRRNVQIFPIYFDAAVTRKAVLRLFDDSRSTSVEITDRASRSVALPAGPFSWGVAWTRADGTSVAESPPEPGDDVIVVPRFRDT